MNKIGDYKMFKDPHQGWYVAMLCPMNTRNPNPYNAFWQQVSKYYQYQKCALKILAKKTCDWDNLIAKKKGN